MMLSIASPGNAFCDMFDSGVGAVEAIAAVLNLALVIYFFFRDKKEFREKEDKRIKEQVHYAWYDALIRERLLNTIDDYFDSVESVITKDGVGQERFLEDIRDIKNIFNRYKRLVFPTLILFSDELKKSVWGLIQENHDQILNEYEKSHYDGEISNKIFELINETKTKVYKELYDYDINKLEDIIKNK